jgi:hypothetical protein
MTLRHPVTRVRRKISVQYVLLVKIRHPIDSAPPCTGWRRLVGSPKLQIIFHKRATKYRAHLRKMTYKDKGSY